ncbi:MAG TPA: protein-disulfide reductase DsbD domain-containing protein [Methylomirabilota bacterium]|nr:protein-disulfide reductase DsbD domain-containing protein [Methylomirabilota bacterium]
MSVRHVGIFLICFCFAIFLRAQTALPSFGSSLSAHHTQAKLILSADTAKPGDTIWAGVDLKMESGWHTYWKNPGAAGSPTKIEWQLPPGISAGEIQWPLPKKLPPAEVTTYGYEDEVMLLVPLTIETNLPAGALNLAAKVSWLECREVCIPANRNVEAKLNIGSESKNSADAATVEMWKSKTPKAVANLDVYVWWHDSTNTNPRTLIIQVHAVQTNTLDFFPDANDSFEIQPETKSTYDEYSNSTIVNKLVKKFSGDWPKEISGVLVLNSREGFEVKIPVSDQTPAGETISASNSSSVSRTGVAPVSNLIEKNAETGAPPVLPLMLLYAFIGGLILNIMPCVLPVIALKILGFVSEARSEPRRVRNLGLIYVLGVLISFLALAAIVIGVKAAGHRAGWGMQFGSPIFIVCLTTLVMLVALNLFGVFEVTLGGRTLNAAGQLASRHGASGAFFNGILATTLATPCTAPFLAPALGFAFSQSSATIILIFLAAGFGLASPYILLSCNPALLKFLPKPGAWMEKFKIAMGFPLLATVVWLFNVASSSYGKNVLWLGIFLVIVALAAWIFGEFVQRGRKHKTAAIIIVLLLLGGGYVFALEKELDWREAMPEANTSGSLKESANGIDWQRWSPEAVAQARAAGKPVLVDFTADWCLTCQVNKKTSIEISSIRKKLKDLNAVALVADYTHFPDAITTELQRYNRAGVPLVLVYPKNPDAEPIVLPAILTPGIVLNALDRASR